MIVARCCRSRTRTGKAQRNKLAVWDQDRRAGIPDYAAEAGKKLDLARAYKGRLRHARGRHKCACLKVKMARYPLFKRAATFCKTLKET
jgi:hypothetical protein